MFTDVVRATVAGEVEHVRALRDSVRRFADRHMPPDACARWDKDNHFPREVFDGLVQLGVMGLAVPEEYGGAGRDIVATMACIEELSKRSLAVAVPYIMSACYAGLNLVECGSTRQKQELLPRVAADGLMFAYGWSEPDIGSDVASVRTAVRRSGDLVVVDGVKRFCSGAEICDYIFVLCQSGAPQHRYRNLSVVLVPPNAPGVKIRKIDSLGMKGPATTDVTFDDVRVPFESVIGEEAGWDDGWSIIAGSGLDVEKLEVAAMAQGLGEAAFDEAWRYAEQRNQFGRAIATYQSIRHKLADMATQLHGSRLMLYHAARLSNERVRCGVETSMAKLYASEVSKSVALEAQTILGAYGYVKDFRVERLVRDALLMPIIGGSSAIQRNNIVNWAGLGR